MARICRTCLMVSGIVKSLMMTVSRMMATPICWPVRTYSNISRFRVGRMMNSVHGLNPANARSPSTNTGSPVASKDVTSQPT